MTVEFWAAGRLYQPGAVVQPTPTAPAAGSDPTNPDFESGDIGWTRAGGLTWTLGAGAAFTGANRASAAFGTTDLGTLTNNNRASAVAGQAVTARAYIKREGVGTIQGRVGLVWFDAADVVIRTDFPEDDDENPVFVVGATDFWRLSTITATAPSTTAKVAVVLDAIVPTAGTTALFDSISWDYAFQSQLSDLVFRAVFFPGGPLGGTQAVAGTSGSSEPVWPTVAGNTVDDNELRWLAVAADRVIWRMLPILTSGAAEPVWPLDRGAFVADGTISWEAITRQVLDDRLPESQIVQIAASKIFAADGDIIPFSATINPLNWSEPEDSGFLPFGLQTHGAMPVAAMGLYRSNLVAFNAQGFQMWQVDEDPVNMALLDAEPVGSTFHRAIQPFMNDLLFLTQEGIRSLGIAGASINLQAGDFGKAVDPIVQAALPGSEPIGISHPGAGQYWLVFGAEAIVLTANGTSADGMSWSRYTFPSAITDWTILGADLYLRSGDKIWKVDPDALNDDETAPGVGTAFTGELRWHYLDFGLLGEDKQMTSFDLVCTGTVDISFGYDQTDTALATAPYSVVGDTLPGTPIPMPITGPSFQMRLTFAGNQEWEWFAAGIHIVGVRG